MRYSPFYALIESMLDGVPPLGALNMHIYDTPYSQTWQTLRTARQVKSCMIQEHCMLENLPTTSLLPIPVINIGTIEWMACNNDKYMETISRKPTIYCTLK